MVVLITTHYKNFLEQEFPEYADPLGGTRGITIAVMQRYVSAAGIPLTGTRKIAQAFSNESGQPIPVLLWTEDMKHIGNQMISQTTGAWKRRLPGQVFLLALVLGIFYIFAYTNINTQSAGLQEDYKSHPQAGDIVLAQEYISNYKKDVDQPFSLVVFKIEEIRGDSMLIRRGKQKVDTMEQYRIKNKNKLIGLFDLSDDAFLPDTEVYSLSKYREGDKQLRRIRLVNPTPQEQKWQDSLLNYTDIIEPLFIKRTEN